jgi:CrcB protein
LLGRDVLNRYRILLDGPHNLLTSIRRSLRKMLAFLTHPVVLLTLGGALGTNARYWLGAFVGSRVALHQWDLGHFPLATFLINVSGALLLGLFVMPFRDRLPIWYILLGVGFCGGYTTFSAFALETVELVRRHHQPGMAILYVMASVVVGCAMTWVAVASMERYYPKPPPAPPAMEAADPEKKMEP